MKFMEYNEFKDKEECVLDTEQLNNQLNNFSKQFNNIANEKVDKVNGKGLSTNDYTTAEKQKLEGLSNYVHPSTHDASIINQDSTHRFVTDEEKAKWNSSSTSSGNNSKNIETYKVETLGELYGAPSNYTAWCANDLQFDKNSDKFVALLYCASAHQHSSSDLYVVYIDKDTFETTKQQKCNYVNTDGTTDITPTQAGSCAFIILKNGTYLMIHSGSDGNIHRLISENQGVTWKSTGTIIGMFSCPWKIKELSNGRLICSDDATNAGFRYSDDIGVTWQSCKPSGTPGDYNAEAEILELETNKLIAIARKNGDGGGYTNNTSSDHAIISYSNDNGTTWSTWKDSDTIDNMEASCCAGIVHDGVVEIFACSRWHRNENTLVNQDCANTGKSGAMFHYIATIENALNDKFSNLGVVTYAKGINGNNADEFHSPCLALDDKQRLLLMYMDTTDTVLCNHKFIRGEINGINYKCADGSDSKIKPPSSAYVNILFANMLEKINTLQYALSQIEGSGVDEPTGTLIWTAEYNAQKENKTLTSLTSNALYSRFYTNNTGAGYNKILTDTDGDTYYCSEGTSIFTGIVGKVNSAIEITGYRAHSYGVFFGFIINGKGVGIVPASGKHTWKVINENGRIKAYVDNAETETVEKTISDDDTSAVLNFLGISEWDTRKVYLYARISQNNARYYEVKYGEWDS